MTVVFDVVDGRHLTDQVDVRVSDRLGDVIGPGRLGARAHLRLPPDNDVDDAPIVFWRVNANGKAIALTGGTPLLPARSWSSPGQPTTAVLGNDQFRLIAAPFGTGWLVAGQSLAQARHVEAVVERAEVIAGPAFVLVMFFGALAIGLLASRPVEQARRRQLEFTADASHELRTPLTVIEAEVDLALSSPRDGISYRGTLRRIGAEGKRLRRIVEDLLFLARFDANPPVPGDEPVDLRTIAEGCVQRFSAVAEARGIDLSIRAEGADAILVKAPPAWVDRLCGVLVDNACRYAGNGGSVRVLVAARANSVGIAVEDSGPGSHQSNGHFFSTGSTEAPKKVTAPAWDWRSLMLWSVRPEESGVWPMRPVGVLIWRSSGAVSTRGTMQPTGTKSTEPTRTGRSRRRSPYCRDKGGWQWRSMTWEGVRITSTAAVRTLAIVDWRTGQEDLVKITRPPIRAGGTGQRSAASRDRAWSPIPLTGAQAGGRRS